VTAGSRAAFLLAFCFCVPAFAQENSQYVPAGEIEGSAEVKHRAYTFEVIPPYSVYRSMGWHRFSDRNDQGSTILVTGMGGYDSYALSVLSVSDPVSKDPLAIAKQKYPSIQFALHPTNPVCAVSDLSGAPQQLDRGMQAHVAECVDPKTGKAYELTISWRSMLMLVTGAEASGAQCDKDAEGHIRCPRREGPLREAMDKFVGSFRFRD
jgi:hypothetical protein